MRSTSIALAALAAILVPVACVDFGPVLPSGEVRDAADASWQGSSSGSGSSSGGTTGGGSETLLIPCDVNQVPGTPTVGQYSSSVTYAITLTGTCSLFPSTDWTSATCGTPGAQPEYPSTNDNGPVGSDAYYTFATPGACGDAGFATVVNPIIDVNGIVPGTESADNGYAPSHAYTFDVTPLVDGPMSFFVNWVGHTASSPQFYGEFQAIITVKP